MNYHILFRCICFAILFFTAGCSSIKTTLVTKDNTNQVWEKHRRLKGVPITLKVPTHIKVFVFDKHYLEEVKIGDQSLIQPVDLDLPVRDFSTEFIYTDKIFTVDFKRPGAGTFNSKFELSEDQYFKEIQHNVTDKTIEQVTNLFSNLIPANQSGIFKPVSKDVTAVGVKEIKSLAAVGVFELDAIDFERQVMNFINCHINKSHDAFVVPPKAQLKRVEPTVTQLPTSPLCKSASGVPCNCSSCQISGD